MSKDKTSIESSNIFSLDVCFFYKERVESSAKFYVYHVAANKFYVINYFKHRSQKSIIEFYKISYFSDIIKINIYDRFFADSG